MALSTTSNCASTTSAGPLTSTLIRILQAGLEALSLGYGDFRFDPELPSTINV